MSASFPFTPAFRAELAARCAAFPRLAYAGEALKRAAVAITLVDAGDGSGARRWGLNTHHGWTLALTDADVAPGDVEGCVGAIG